MYACECAIVHVCVCVCARARVLRIVPALPFTHTLCYFIIQIDSMRNSRLHVIKFKWQYFVEYQGCVVWQHWYHYGATMNTLSFSTWGVYVRVFVRACLRVCMSACVCVPK